MSANRRNALRRHLKANPPHPDVDKQLAADYPQLQPAIKQAQQDAKNPKRTTPDKHS